MLLALLATLSLRMPSMQGNRVGGFILCNTGFDAFAVSQHQKLGRTPSLLPAAFQHLEPAGRTRKADVTWRIVSAVAGAGYFLAGDAASTLDPLSSHGVLKGLLSGLQIAHLLFHSPWRDATEARIVLAYTDWTLQLFQQDIRHLTHLYRQINPQLFPSVD